MLSMSALTNSVKNVFSFFLKEKFIFIVFFFLKMEVFFMETIVEGASCVHNYVSDSLNDIQVTNLAMNHRPMCVKTVADTL